MINIFGFSLLRNGVKYDYSFKESFSSLASVTAEVYIALGDSEDTSEEELKKVSKIKIIPTVWDMSKREGGLILSEQTNIALNQLRVDKNNLRNSWGIYLQADEVFHEEDYELIIKDLQAAEENGCDVMTFRYLHFWQSHHQIAINKKWYPQEIRAVRLDSNIESWGDAQSFRNFKKVYHSEAKIFHYGHVREADSYKSKKEDILKLYHSDSRISKYQKREKKFDNLTKTLDFWGSHPKIMKSRIEKMGETFSCPRVEKVYIVGELSEKYKFITRKINADQIILKSNLKDVPRPERRQAVILKPSLVQKILYPSRVPKKMYSKWAHDWSEEFIFILKLSEKRIGLI